MAVAALALPIVLAMTADAADDGQPAPLAPVHVVQVEGNLDPILADYLTDRLARAGGEGAQVVIITVDSEVSHDVDGAALAGIVRRASVPVVAWVGGPGAAARGIARDLVAAADLATASEPVVIDPVLPIAAERAGTLRELVISLHDRVVDGRRLVTATFDGATPRAVAPIVFFKPDFPSRVIHSVGSPHIALFLLAAGMTAVLFEVFTAGIGLAALTGAVCLALAGSGLAALPTRWPAVAVVVLAFVPYAADLQDGRTTWRTWAGAVLLSIGAAGAFLGAPSGARAEWWLLALLVVLTHAFWLVAMRVMVRTRYATPQIRRDGLVGEEGTTVTTVAPVGVVEVRGATWRARSADADFPAGMPVRVTGSSDDALRVVAVTEEA